MSKAPQGSVRFADSFLAEVAEIAKRLDAESIERAAALLATVRERGGRLFIIGVGGSAANASHAVNDFRKLTGMEAYAPTDNVSELTARINDEGWQSVFAAWLETSRLQPRDAVLVFSVGGGSVERNVSPNIVAALDYSRRGPGWRPRSASRRCLGAHSGGAPGPDHSAYRSFSVCHLAPSGFASVSAANGGPMGIHHAASAAGCISGSRRSAQRTCCPKRKTVSAGLGG